VARIELDEGEKNKIDAEIEAIADDEDVGEKEKQKGRWWTEQQGGTILLTIRYGNKVIELEQGKNAIELSSISELAPTLQSIKQAVDDGEFDTIIEQQLAYGSGLNRKRHNIRVL